MEIAQDAGTTAAQMVLQWGHGCEAVEITDPEGDIVGGDVELQ